jgi:hypothetical protein
MLTDEVRQRAERQVKKFTDAYAQSKGIGYNVTAMGLPIFDSQDDFDRCRPEEAGQDFLGHNEFIDVVIKGLQANKVPAETVVFHYAEFSKWLNGRPITTEARSAYAGHLAAEQDRKKKKH